MDGNTLKARKNFTLSEKAFAMLGEMAKYRGVSMSSFLEMLIRDASRYPGNLPKPTAKTSPK